MNKKDEKKKLIRAILKECSVAVQRGLGSKRAGSQARHYWIFRGTRSITRQVNKKVDWEQAKKRVLPSAMKMGKIAAVLTGDLKVVPIWAAEGAAVAIKHDRKCPPGRGGFCP